MDLHNLKENRQQIINEYSEELNPIDARHIRYEIDWLLSKADDNDWCTFEDAYMDRIAEKLYSKSAKENIKYYFRCIFKKLYPGCYFMPRVYCHYEDPSEMLRRSKGYKELNHGYQELVDAYVLRAKNAGKKRDTIFTHCNLASGFLRHLEDKGAGRLEEASEQDVISFFYADGLYRHQIRSYSYKEKLVVFFSTCMDCREYSAGCRRILNMIPALRYVRKNVEYLTSSEAEMIRDTIDSEHFSPRERAAMMLLLYTGLRSCDVAAIKLCDIDWETETINIVQQKTSEPLVIAMVPTVGNSIFDYLNSGYPVTLSGYLFCEAGIPEKHVTARTIRNIAYKTYRLAGIRQGKGEHKGTHLFRHYAATKMLESGVQRPAISRTLGHTDPESLGPYLHADFKHLGELALGLESYPMPEEVWIV